MRASKDLISLETEWGISVSEATPRKGPVDYALYFASIVFLIFASLVMLPPLVALILIPRSEGLAMEAGVVLALIAAGVFLRRLARRGPKNALQIDRASGEVRLGSVDAKGVFVRHRVCPLTAIERIEVDSETRELRLVMNGQTANIRLATRNTEMLERVADEILGCSRKGARPSDPVAAAKQTFRDRGLGARTFEARQVEGPQPGGLTLRAVPCPSRARARR